MANIVHESAGATSKNLAVTGVTIAPPQPSNIWFDLQIDSGITAVDGKVSSWTDSVNGNKLEQNNAGNRPLLDFDNQLKGLPTVRFVVGPTLYDKSILKKLSTLTGNPGSNPDTWAMLYYSRPRVSGGQGDWQYLFDVGHVYYGGGGTRVGMSEVHDTGELWTPWHTNSIHKSLGITSNHNDWNILIFRFDPAVGYTCYLNGVMGGGAEVVYNGNWDEMRIGSYSESAQPSLASIAALISWKNVDFTESEYHDAYLYLTRKYGLS